MDFTKPTNSIKSKLKGLVVLFTSLITVFQLQAQAPGAFNYQALARDAAGKAISSKAISIRASIVTASATGNVEYAETHAVTTDEQGLFALELGHGTAVTGSFAGVAWSQGNKWLKIEMDAAGGSNFSLIGASQLLSVPYAQYANTSGSTTGDPGSSYDGSIVDLEKSNAFDNVGLKAKVIGSGRFTYVRGIIDAAKNMYLYGSVSGNASLGSIMLDPALYTNFIAKILPDGTVSWAKGTNFSVNTLSIAGANLVLATSVSKNLMYGTATFPVSAAGQYDDLVLAISGTTGEVAWSQKFDHTKSSSPSIHLIEDNAIYLVSSFERPGFKVGFKTFTNGRGFYITQLNKESGIVNWAVSTDSAAVESSSYITDLKSNAGKLYVVGSVSGTIKLGSATLSTGNTGSKSFVSEFSSSGLFTKADILQPGVPSHLTYANIRILRGKVFFQQQSTITQYDFNTKTSSSFNTDGYGIYTDSTNAFFYTQQHNKYDLTGKNIATGKSAGDLPAYVTPLNNGQCYLHNSLDVSNLANFTLGSSYYNLVKSDLAIIKYDIKNEVILESKLFKHINCKFSNLLLSGDKRFVISYGGTIKANGKILNGLVLLDF